MVPQVNKFGVLTGCTHGTLSGSQRVVRGSDDAEDDATDEYDDGDGDDDDDSQHDDDRDDDGAGLVVLMMFGID